MEWFVEQKVLCDQVHDAPFKELQEYAKIAFEKGEPLGDSSLFTIKSTSNQITEFAMDIPPIFEKYVLDTIHKHFNHHTEEKGICGIDETKLEIVKMWANKMHKGDQHQLHAHIYSFYSFSVYLNVVENDASFLFIHDDQPITVTINKKANQHILIFPSKLLHTVVPKLSDGERISVSGNIVINPFK